MIADGGFVGACSTVLFLLIRLFLQFFLASPCRRAIRASDAGRLAL
jgi:hypothetical protein